MTTAPKMSPLAAGAAWAVILLAGPSAASALTVTVHNAVRHASPAYIGGNEGGAFSTNHLADSGVNLYRIWATIGELEWADDDWHKDGTPGWPTYPTSTYYGVPIPSEIRTNISVIPWDIWEDAFTNSRWTGAVPFREVLDGCRAMDVMPLLVLRPRGPTPGEDWIPWIPNAPDGTNYWNEWWEYCFAVAYWCNVSNNYGITHFEIHNEPDLASQGWSGTQSQYVQLVNYARDALEFANDMTNLPVYIHAPVVASYGSSYISYALTNTDTNIDVVSYHVYDKYHSLTTSIRSVKQTVTNNNPDGVVEPVWITEWGDLDNNYDTVGRGLLTAQQLYEMADGGIEGSAIFMFYDWGGAQSGLIGTNLSPYETYYAFRLVTRGLQPGGDILQRDSSDPSTYVMATRSTNGLYVLGVTVGTNCTVDLSGVGYLAATAEVRKYSATFKDAVTGTVSLVNGKLGLDCTTQEVVSAFLSASAVDDSDFDRMLDAWELQYFPSLTNATSVSDNDGDLFIDLHEYLAGTVPTNPFSLLEFEGVQSPGPAQVVINWSSESNRSYAIDYGADIMQAFDELTSSIAATCPQNAFTDTVDGIDRRYYRIRLEVE